MADTVASPEVAVAASPKIAKAKPVKKPSTAVKKSKPSHPPTSEMVNNAVKTLKERGGSSLQAIKKYLAANYKVDAEKLSPFIKKYIKTAVVNGTFIQTKGKGASGSFKLAASEKKLSVKKVVAKKTTTSPKKKVVKKSAASPKKAVAKKIASAKKPAAPKQKPTKPTKSAAIKTKPAPKPKTKVAKAAPKPKVAAAKKPAVKKAAAKK